MKAETRPMTDHEQAALAALVAWREKKLAHIANSGFSFEWLKAQAEFHIALDALDAAADLLIAERAAVVGR